MNLPPGSIVGSYQVDREVGRGGRAVVYRAWQHTVGRWVVLKVLSQRDPGALEQFRQEAQFTANLAHSGVRQVYDAGQTPDGHAYLAMQYVETSLRQVMRACEEQARMLNCAAVARLLQPVAEVLDCLARQNMAHLDVKPENILVARDGQAVLADFGSARPAGTRTHEGTPRYFSPEQAAGDRPVSAQSDIYSLACVAYELLAGRTPFDGDANAVLIRQHLEEPAPSPRRFNPSLPRSLERVFEQALAKDPRERPASALAFVQGLGAHAGSEGHRPAQRLSSGAQKDAQQSASVRRSRRIGTWGLVALAGVVLLLLLAGILVVAWAMAGAPSLTPPAIGALTVSG